MPWFHPKTLLDKTYEVGIIIKGIDGTFEIIGGILVLVASPAVVHSVTQGSINFFFDGNSSGVIAQHIAKTGQSLAAGHNLYAALFLLTHGGVKVFLVTCLLLNKLWAYPWALAILGLFTVYQTYLLITKPGFGMAFLTVLDIIIIYLIYREWGIVRRKPAKPGPETT